LLLAGLVCWLDRRYALAGVAFTLGILTRETVGVALFGLGVGLVVTKLRGRGPALRASLPAYAALVVPVVVLLAWELILRRRWGDVPASSSQANLGMPVFGVLRTLVNTTLHGRRIHPGGRAGVLWFVERVWLLVVIGFAAISLGRSRARDLGWAWLGVVVLALSLEGWVYDLQFLRATNEAAMMSLLVVTGRPGIAGTRILAASAVLMAVVCAWFIVHA
jgi:hypothetical protein